MDKRSLDKVKHKGAATAAATIAAAGVLIGGSFEAPADILKDNDSALAPPPIVETLNAEIDPGDGDNGDEDAAADEEEEKKAAAKRKDEATDEDDFIF